MSGDKDFKEFKELPEGWKWVRLGEVIENTYPGEWGDNPTDNKNIFPVFSTLAIDYDGRIDFTKAVLRKLNKKKTEKFKLKKGMILIEKSGGSTDTPAGKVAILKQDFEGTCSNFIQILKPNNNTCNSYYLFYRLLYNFKNNLTEKYQQKTTGIINFILKEYFNEYIPHPPFPEQQKIAEILETIDNAIEKTDKIIEKYKRIKQGLMQDLLAKGIDENGNIRNKKTHKFKDSPLGKIPEEWEVVRLGEVCDIRISNVDKKIDEKEKKVMLCNYLDVYKNDYITKSINFMIGTATKREIDKFNVLKGDVIITKDSEEFDDIAKPSYVSEEILNLVCGYHLAILRPKNTIDGLFLSKALRIHYVNVFFQKRANGITRFGITKETIENALIPLPPLHEQQRIAEILTQTDQTIEKEQQYKEKLKKIKQGLMQDLLTGKVRVNNLLNEGKGYVYQA